MGIDLERAPADLPYLVEFGVAAFEMRLERIRISGLGGGEALQGDRLVRRLDDDVDEAPHSPPERLERPHGRSIQ